MHLEGTPKGRILTLDIVSGQLWRTQKAYKNLAEGGGLAEPWVLVVKKRVALKERKNPSNAEQ
jgi:hypothetical protein